MPPPQESEINYDELYPSNFSLSSNFIRFSQTVEECIGCLYDMTEEDDEFLKQYNQKKPQGSQLSEDDFELIMEVFEDTASISTPFASVDKTVVAYEHMVSGLGHLGQEKLMPFAKDIYAHWKEQREAKDGSLHPTLKFETHPDTDEQDPYVCFRRREVRQTRKTRQRDVQSADKLKRLRRELEEGRQLILLSHERELLKREILLSDRLIFDNRATLKDTKVRLGIKTDDDDLYTTKVCPCPLSCSLSMFWKLIVQQPLKRKAPDMSVAQRTSGTQLRMPVRPDGRTADTDLMLLADKLAEKENEMLHTIKAKVDAHRHWKSTHVDTTRNPLAPAQGKNVELSFRPAKAQYLITPPASASDSMEEPTPMELDKPEPAPMFHFRGASQDVHGSGTQPSFRRRIGRLNRLWIDRRGLASPAKEVDDTFGDSDRWKFDEDDSDGEQPVYEINPYDTQALRFRSLIPLFAPQGRPRPPDLITNGLPPANGVGHPPRPQQ